MKTQVNLSEIPFYQHRFSLAPKDQEQIIISKQEINQSFPVEWMTKHLRSAIDEQQIEWAATSGTTSDRLQIIRPKNWWDQEYAWLDEQLFPEVNGRDIKRAVLTTALCSADVCSMTQPTFDDRCLGRALYLNLHHDPNVWQKEDVSRMIQELTQWTPDYLLADPVYLSILLKKAAKYDLMMPARIFSKIILGYEYLTSFIRRHIENFFPQMEIRQLYGSTETGFHILENTEGMLECHHREGHLRFKRWQGNIYQVFITSWKNPYMPLVNYDIGDLVTLDRPATDDHLTGHIQAFQGRIKEVIEGRERRLCVGQIDRELSELDLPILQYQIVDQSNRWQLLHTTISDEALNDDQSKNLAGVLKSVLPYAREIDLQHQSTIGPASSGKFKIIHQ